MATSRILYTPSRETHYGSLYCHGKTGIGSGAPCVYIILPPGLSLEKPDCLAVNITHSSFQVVCNKKRIDPQIHGTQENSDKNYDKNYDNVDGASVIEAEVSS